MKAAEHTETGSDEARRAADAAELTLRPWIWARGTQTAFASNTTVNGVLHQNSLGFMCEVENSGPSPALAVRVFFDAQCVPVGAPVTEVAAVMGEPLVLAHGDKKMLGPIFMTDADSALFRAMQRKAFVYFRIEYFSPYKQSGDPYVTEAFVEARHMGGTIQVGGQTVEAIRYSPVGNQNRME